MDTSRKEQGTETPSEAYEESRKAYESIDDSVVTPLSQCPFCKTQGLTPSLVGVGDPDMPSTLVFRCTSCGQAALPPS